MLATSCGGSRNGLELEFGDGEKDRALTSF